ncbi:hypothetical protein N658DRAFT_418511 [Parathielavia hyrcaniae]|uniref:MYND-type domain-containing protein n=1 Tax=Parathielavia hyrcaniae TaxID=113614 RepID=A0AAN6T544_9PEZI|nr:hypothetical protein N658DRAFT_418511 [Parathielavia hyrcaniae]
MTLTKPTLLLTDQPQEKTTATPFALVFSSRSASGPDTLDLAKLGYKRGSTLVIPHARRTLPPLKPQLKPEDTPEPEDKPRPGFIAVDRQIEGDVRVVPGSLAKVVEVGCWLRGRDDRRMEREAEDEDEDEEKGGRGCESCGAGMKKDERGKGGGLMRCTGCGEVEYCSKACQARGWNEGGHKEDCKVIKAIRTIWP